MTDFTYPPGGSSVPPVRNGSLAGGFLYSWPSAASAVVANGTYPLSQVWLWQTGSITGLTAKCANGSFTASVLIGGAPVAGLGGVLVNNAAPATTPAGPNALTAGSVLTLVISGVSGAPTDATVQVNCMHSPI